MKIFHNARCSKSRAALDLLKERQQAFTVVNYLETPPTLADLQQIATSLGLRPKDFYRSQEPIAQSLDIDLNDDAAVLQAMQKHPILIERPIILQGSKAVIARPIENLSLFLDELC